MTLQIYCNNDNIIERTWIIDVFFSEFLKVDYQLHFIETDCYEIKFGEKSIILADNFFKYYSQPLAYLSKNNFPVDICFSEFQIAGRNFPVVVLYGKDGLCLTEDLVRCESDLFASAFFMLSRWEEHCIEAKDAYGTCDENQLLSVKHSFFKRPIVNEYVEIIRAFFVILGYPVSDDNRKSQTYLTYDVDDLFFTGLKKWKYFIRTLGGDVIRRKSLKMFLRRIHFFLCNLGRDLYDPFEELLQLNPRAYALFFFKAQVRGEFGATYDISDKRLKPLFARLKSAGCHIGLHSSEIAYNNREQLDREISRLKQSAGLDDIDGSRNHMLFYDVNQLEYLAGQDIFLDSTFGFHFRNGFRCGICQKYPMFNYLSRHVMEVYQLPFSIKDNGSFYLNKTAESMRSDILSTISTVKRYRGDIVFLWHTNKLNSFEKMNYKKVYLQMARNC